MAARAWMAAGDVAAAADLFGWDDGRVGVPSPDSEPHGQGLWYGVGAQLAALHGDGDRAREWAARAVEVTGAMRSPPIHADTLTDVARAYRSLGDTVASEASLAAARAQYVAKGAIGLASTMESA
jgi:hypothetical protein